MIIYTMADDSKVILTPQKYKQLKDELDELSTIGRKLIADKLDQYRGEVRDEDSAAFSDVLAEKEGIERRIEELTEILENAIVSDKCEAKGTVSVGCVVKIKKGKKEKEFNIVSPMESDPENNKISNDSPLGKALSGKKVGDEVEVNTPSGKEKWKVVKIK